MSSRNIKAKALQIKNETQARANSANRVGGLFEDIADELTDLEGGYTGLTEKVFGGNNYTEGYYLDASGTRVASANWCVSNPIPLDADAFGIGLRLIFGGYINTARFCFFDSNNQLVTAFGLTESGSRNLTSSQLAGSTSATYCILSFAKGTVGEVTTIGKTKTYYTSGTTPSIDEKIEGIIVDDSNLADDSVTNAKLANNSVSMDKVSFKVNSKNLLNYEDEDFTPNTYLPNLNSNKQYSTSGFIPVEPGKSYVVSRIGAAVNFRMAYGYTSKTSTGVSVATNASTFSIAENSDIKFVRVTIYNNANKTQIEEGTTPTAYEDYGSYIDPQVIKAQDNRVNFLVTPPEFVFPSTIYALKGYQNSVYHKNYLKYWLPDVWAIQGNSSSSAWSYRERCFRIEATQSGISNLKMSLFNKITLEQKTAEITIPTNFVQVADNPIAINVNAIGDSFTYNGEWVKTIAERLNNVNLVGMRQSYSMTGSMRGEGRGGWKLATYAKPHDDLTPNHMQPFSPFMHVSGYTYYGPIEFWKAIVTDTSQYTYGTNGFDDYKTWFDSDGYKINPSVNDLMYNGTTNKYVAWNGSEWAETAITDADFNWDYARYIATWNIAAPSVVLILLGTNDFLSGYSGFEVWKSQMDGLINSIKAYNTGIKVGICTAFVTTGAANNSDRINRFISTRNEWEARKLVISNFDTAAYKNNGIYVVDTGAVIDPDYGFDMQAQKPFADYAGDETELYAKNGVHCGAGGYKQLGTCAAAFVEYVRTKIFAPDQNGNYDISDYPAIPATTLLERIETFPAGSNNTIRINKNTAAKYVEGFRTENLLNSSYNNIIVKNVNITYNNGRYTFNGISDGTAGGRNLNIYEFNDMLLPAGNYYLNIDNPISDANLSLYINNKDEAGLPPITNISRTTNIKFSLEKDTTVRIGFNFPSSVVTFDNLTVLVSITKEKPIICQPIEKLDYVVAQANAKGYDVTIANNESDIKLIEKVEFDGTKYIDTGIDINGARVSEITAEIDIVITNFDNSMGLLSATTVDSTNSICLFLTKSSDGNYYLISSAKAIKRTYVPQITIQDMLNKRNLYGLKNMFLTFNDKNDNNTFPDYTIDADNSTKIGCRHIVSNNRNSLYGNIFSVILNDNLFIPAYNNSTNGIINLKDMSFHPLISFN